MLADSMPAAHFALTETSAHPVSKSGFKRRLHDPMPSQKRSICGQARHIRPKLVVAMSVGEQMRRTQPEQIQSPCSIERTAMRRAATSLMGAGAIIPVTSSAQACVVSFGQPRFAETFSQQLCVGLPAPGHLD